MKPVEIVRTDYYNNRYLYNSTETFEKRRCNLSHNLAKTVKTSDGKFHSTNYIER